MIVKYYYVEWIDCQLKPSEVPIEAIYIISMDTTVIWWPHLLNLKGLGIDNLRQLVVDKDCF